MATNALSQPTALPHYSPQIDLKDHFTNEGFQS